MTEFIRGSFMRATPITTLLLTMVAGTALAVPTLQLDIIGGTYDPVTETIVATSDTFTLVALLTPKNNASWTEIKALLSDTYYISSALSPQVESPTMLGSFDFEGMTFDATDDMTFGNPPVETAVFRDPGDLQTHGIFPTYFIETEFQFSKFDKTTTYNTQDSPGSFSPGGSGSYYATFEVDVSGLDPEHTLHFDLYNTVVKNGGDIDTDDFAPFSHDAESGGSGPGGGGGPNIPEPGTLFLLGTGLALVRATTRRRKKAPTI